MKGPSVIETDRAIWEAMLSHLRAHNPTICRQWFEELSPLGVGAGALQLRTLSSLHRDYLKKQCADAFNDAARTVSGRLLSVRFLGPEDEVIPPPTPPAAPRKAAPPSVMRSPDPSRDVAAPVPFRHGDDGRTRATSDLAAKPSPADEAPLESEPNQHARHARHAGHDGHAGESGNNGAADTHSHNGEAARASTPPMREDETRQPPHRDDSTQAMDRARDQHDQHDQPDQPERPDQSSQHEDSNARDPHTQEPPLVIVPGRTPVAASPAPNTPDAPHAPYTRQPPPRSRSWSGPVPQRYESLVVNPDNAFDTFVVGPANRLAHAAAMAVVTNPGRVYNPFFVHGGVGLGKTHLLQAVCLKLVEANPRLVLYYTSCENFVTQYVESVQSGEMSDFRHRFRDVDVLVIDDIHFLTKRDQSQEEFFHTFNSLYQAHKQIILSSDAPPEDIPQLEDRLVSRFKWGLVAKIEPPSYETRVEILKTKARLRGLEMPAAVAEYIAGRLDTNIRELEGAVVKLQIQAVVEKRPIDLELARAALGDVPAPVVGEPTIQTIIGAVTEHYSIRLADLQSKHRQRSIALPRQVCMFLARRCTRHSLEEIGGFFGGRDHTTVMHAIRTVEARREIDAEFENVLRVLEERVRASKH